MIPAVHWVSHGLHASSAAASAADDGHAVVSPASLARTCDVCPGCLQIRTMHATGPDALPLDASVVRPERAVPPPSDPAVLHDVAAPVGRGPPSRA